MVSPQNILVRNFHEFSPREYLAHYYAHLGKENRFLLQFFHQFYRDIPLQKNLLEMGGGPSLYQLISASSKIENITFSDYLQKNREEVLRWLHDDLSSFNWDPYFAFVLRLEQKTVNSASLEQIKQRLKSKIRTLIACDLRTQSVVSHDYRKPFAVVSTHFCPESITHKKDEFLQFMERVTRFVKPEGYLLMSLLKNAKFYSVGMKKFPAYPVNEQFMGSLLPSLGYIDINIASIESESIHDYAGIIALSARKS